MLDEDRDVDWEVTTWQGNRMRQHREFRALPFREKIRLLEEMDEVATVFRQAGARALEQVRRDGQ